VQTGEMRPIRRAMRAAWRLAAVWAGAQPGEAQQVATAITRRGCGCGRGCASARGEGKLVLWRRRLEQHV
jgi:hypothetical protein